MLAYLSRQLSRTASAQGVDHAFEDVSEARQQGDKSGRVEILGRGSECRQITKLGITLCIRSECTDNYDGNNSQLCNCLHVSFTSLRLLQ